MSNARSGRGREPGLGQARLWGLKRAPICTTSALPAPAPQELDMICTAYNNLGIHTHLVVQIAEHMRLDS